MKVTIRKIAEIAKVSKSTVDIVLNNKPGVSDEVRCNVKKIADELNYKPNVVAKALNYQRNPLVIGIIIPREENPFFDEIRRGFDVAYKEIKDFGFKVEYYTVNNFDFEEQLKVINYLADKKISGLALRVTNHEEIRLAIDKIAENNLPVVTFDSDVINSKRLCFVGEDHIGSGKVAGELMGKILNGTGKVAIITGGFNVLGHNLRIQGFKTFLEQEFPNIEIVQTIETFEQEVITYEKTLSLLKSEKDLKGIFISAGNAKVVGNAVKHLNKGTDLKIVSYNFSPEIVELLKEGIIDLTIGLDPFTQGYETMKILFEYLFNKKSPGEKHIKTPIHIGIKSNIDLF